MLQQQGQDTAPHTSKWGELQLSKPCASSLASEGEDLKRSTASPRSSYEG